MQHEFEADQWLPFPLPVVFAFFANPQNLPPLMPAWQEARVEELRLIAPPRAPEGSPSRMGTGVGTTMILSFRMVPKLPLRLYWHALIAEFEWNHHFCDVQTAGPFAHWRHCHSVRVETRDGVEGTVVQDRVEYALPGGPVGDLAYWVAGKRQVAKMFAVRQEKTAKLMPLFAERLAGRTAR